MEGKEDIIECSEDGIIYLRINHHRSVCCVRMIDETSITCLSVPGFIKGIDGINRKLCVSETAGVTSVSFLS
jgi:hypothetical protein